MSDRNNRVVAYVTDEEDSQLKHFADEAGKSKSQVVREAVTEYLDRDRAARVEGKVDNLEEKLDEVLGHLSADSTHTHKDSTSITKATSSTKKVREMVRAVYNRDREVIKNEDLERIIGNYSGEDPRTIRKYKDLMRKRGFLLERPGDVPTWTTDTDMWVQWLSDHGNLNGADAVDEFLEPYPASITETADGLAIDTERLEASP